MFNLRKNNGFTLVEILVVMVIMGLVVTAVYSLYISTQRTASTSEEVVDVQQNLRVALDTLVSDIRMAGFLVPSGVNAVFAAPDVIYPSTSSTDIPDADETFTIQTRSSSKSYARVTGEELGTSKGIRVEEAMALNFRDGNDIIVVRPTTGMVVTGPREIGEPVGNLLPITGYAASGVREGDIVVRKLAGEADVAVISYWLRPVEGGGDNNFELMRGDGNSNSVIATNINALNFRYILDDGLPPVNTTAAVDRIRAVLIEITGATDNTRTGLVNYSGIKSRSIGSVASIRNSFGD